MLPIGSLGPFMQKSGELERSKQEQRTLEMFYVVLERALPFRVLLAFRSLKQISRKTVHAQPNQLLSFFVLYENKTLLIGYLSIKSSEAINNAMSGRQVLAVAKFYSNKESQALASQNMKAKAGRYRQ